MLLIAAMVYHFAYHSGAIMARVSYHAVADHYGNTGITDGTVAIDNGSQHFTVDLAQLMPIRQHHILMAKDGGCGLLQPLAVASHYVAVEVVWAEKGCLPKAYFVDADTGAVVETVDLDHRWDHRLELQPARFDGEAIHVDSVAHVVLVQAHYSWASSHIDAEVPWNFVIVTGRDESGARRAYAYEYAKTHFGRTPDPGWNIFPSPGSVVYVGPLTGLFPFSYHPDPEVLRLSHADDARYTARQEPDTPHYIRAMQRGQWLTLSQNDVQALQFPQALDAFAKMLSLEDDQSLYAEERAMYEQCRVMVAQVQAGKMSATSARTAWWKGCRYESGR